MKIKLYLLGILSLCSIATNAQDFSLGGSLGFVPIFEHNRVGTEITNNFSNSLSAGLFVDFHYGLVSIGIQQSLGGVHSWNGDEQVDQYHLIHLDFTNLEISLLGKFPFDLTTGLSLAPALGLSYRFNLLYKDGSLSKEDLTDERYAELNDFLLRGGGIFDIELATNQYFRVGAFFAYNLNTYQQSLRKEAFCSCDEYLTYGFTPELTIAYGFIR